MTKKDEGNFESSTKCWIYDDTFVESNGKVRDHFHVIGKYRGAEHRYCNINVSLNYKIMFHNLNNYDVHLIIWNLENSI